MAKTLLELVQDVLSEINGDEVTSITDTEESEFIATVFQNTYRDLSSNSNWPLHRESDNLTQPGAAEPTTFDVNDDVKQLLKVWYDKRPSGSSTKQWEEVTYKDPDDFLVYTWKRDTAQSNVDTVYSGSFLINILNDKAPDYYTSFDDTKIVMDSYDSVIDGTSLNPVKVASSAFVIKGFTIADSFVPVLPPEAESLLYNETLARVQLRAREFQDIKAQEQSLKQSRWMSRNAFRAGGGIRYRDYGRKR